jgi:O-methyltransferase
MKIHGRAIGGVKRRAKEALEQFRRQIYPRGVRQCWTQVRRESLTYATDKQLHQLLRAVQSTASSRGLIIEAGTARGGSAILMCAAKAIERPLRVYDVFDMIPSPSEHDGPDMKDRYEQIASGQAKGLDGGRYYLYEDDLQAVVTENFRRLGYPIERHHVELIKGKVQDTLSVNEPVALAHVDVDWYEPVTACLERITPHLVVGGSIALHAYGDWSGCRKAADDYFGRVGKDGFGFDMSAGHLLVTRKQVGQLEQIH